MKTFAVYGPPGCGKTTEMLRRVELAALVYKKSEIGFLSFTKAGAAEALKRLNLTRSNTICTIHSMMFRMGGFMAASVVDSYKLAKFGDKAGFRFRGQSNDTGEQMELGDQYLAILSKALNRMVDLREEYHESDRPGDWSGFEFFCKSYQSWKRANGYADFNDMLLNYVQSPTPHGIAALFVDEAQDLSDLQWAVINRMMGFESVQEVHIAGDDDQAIYEWSGANTHGMAEFEDRNDSERHILRLSWRVPSSVHSVAMGIAGQIQTRVEKEYHPKQHGGPGQVIRLANFDAKTLVHGSDTMILCRNYITRKEIEDELIRFRIPYRNEGGMPGLFSSRIAQAIRVFNRLKAGGTASAEDIERLVLVADDRTKKELSGHQFAGMLSRGYMRSFKIPLGHIDFYTTADFDSEPTIRLSTIHSAKGREADRVILHTGLTDKTHRDMDRGPAQADAEARVWYVGVTRAKNTLEILEGDNGYEIRT
jgi:DNA helicase-2/ATP-dependent DNA helicase PcrA